MSHIPFSVTSDCKVVGIGIVLYKCAQCGLIQKDSTAELQQNYFNEFISHSLSDGEEQVKFINGVPYPRSELIINKLKKNIKKQGTILDIGTGSGSFLKSFKQVFKDWTLCGQDIQDNSKEQLLSILDNNDLYIGDIQNINRKFDLISLIHVMGHVVELNFFLSSMDSILKDEGQIIIQTPDLETGFFDIVVVDQITHFTQYSLSNIMSSRFKNICFFDTINKELTLGININSFLSTRNNQYIDIGTIAIKFKKFIEYLYRTNKQYIVLGCSPSSTYIGAVLNNNLKYFVDEDKNKIGRIHLNRKIKPLINIHSDNIIILPFLDDNIIEEITMRYSLCSFLTYKDIR